MSPNPRKQVRSCKDCPMSYEVVLHGTICNHPDGQGRALTFEEEHYTKPPEWCPLRSAPLLIWFASLGQDGKL